LCNTVCSEANTIVQQAFARSDAKASGDEAGVGPMLTLKDSPLPLSLPYQDTGMTATEQHGSSFVIRIWHEEANAEEDRAQWRGWVQHTRSGESVYVRDLQEVFEFMERWTGTLATGAKPVPRLK